MVGLAFVAFAMCILSFILSRPLLDIPAATLVMSAWSVVDQGPLIKNTEKRTQRKIDVQQHTTVKIAMRNQNVPILFDLNKEGGLLLKRSASKSTRMEQRTAESAAGKVMYSLPTCGLSRYRENVKAVRETWAAAVAS